MKNEIPFTATHPNDKGTEDGLNLLAIDCCPLTNVSKSVQNKAIITQIPEQNKKQNFRQFIRSLREECNNSGPLLASSEDQTDATDDEGFTIAHRHKKGRKSKSSRIAFSRMEENLDENTRLPCACDNSEYVVASDDNKLKSIPCDSEKNLDSVFEFLKVKFPDLKESEFKKLVQMIQIESKSSFTNLSSEEILLKISELKVRSKTQDMENTKRKQAWCNTPQAPSTRKRFDVNECPICYLPLENKVTLEECGHCFHSECIRLWMKQKKTCPFCAGFSLLLDEFPRL